MLQRKSPLVAKSRPQAARNRLPLYPQQRTFEFQNRRSVAKSRRSKAGAAWRAWSGSSKGTGYLVRPITPASAITRHTVELGSPP